MEKKSIKELAIELAVEITLLCENAKVKAVYANQILRSCSSIGATAHEAKYAQSKADFSSKLSIALKESSETSYWLTLLVKTDYLPKNIYDSLKSDVDELIRMIIASLKTVKDVKSNQIHD